MHPLVKISADFLLSGIVKRSEKNPKFKSAQPVGIETENAILLELAKRIVGAKIALELFKPIQLALGLDEWKVAGESVNAKAGGTYENRIRSRWDQCDIVIALNGKVLFGEVKTTTSMFANVFGLLNKHVTSIRAFGSKHVSIIHYPEKKPSSLRHDWVKMSNALMLSNIISRSERDEVVDNFFILSGTTNPLKSRFLKLDADMRLRVYRGMLGASDNTTRLEVLKSYGMIYDSDLDYKEWDRLMAVSLRELC